MENPGIGTNKARPASVSDTPRTMKKISPYAYEPASQLLEDFWYEVEKIMGRK